GLRSDPKKQASRVLLQPGLSCHGGFKSVDDGNAAFGDLERPTMLTRAAFAITCALLRPSSTASFSACCRDRKSFHKAKNVLGISTKPAVFHALARNYRTSS